MWGCEKRLKAVLIDQKPDAPDVAVSHSPLDPGALHGRHNVYEILWQRQESERCKAGTSGKPSFLQC